MKTFAFSDVHGMYEELKIVGDYIDSFPGEKRVIGLGDYVDRGHSSRKCIEYLKDRNDWILLRGNHDQMMYDALYKGRMSSYNNWMYNGGHMTLHNYHSTDTAREDAQWLFDRTLTIFEDDHRIYVHAGLIPGRHYSKTDDHTRMWIRDEFLKTNYDFGKLVIHGHTPTIKPDIQKYRLGIDTGCCFPNGFLTLAEWDEEQNLKLYKIKKEYNEIEEWNL